MNGHSQDWFEIACVRTGCRNSHWIAILFIIGRESRIVIKTHPGQILSGVTEQHIKIEVGNSLCSLKQIGVLRTLTGNFVFLVHVYVSCLKTCMLIKQLCQNMQKKW